MTSASFDFDSALLGLNLFFNVVVVLRLASLKIYRTYPFFFAFLCVPLILQTAVVKFGPSSFKFFEFYVKLEPIRNILYILVVWELFSVVFVSFDELRSVSRWVMGVAAAIASIGLLATVAGAQSSVFSPGRVALVVRYERAIAFSLVIFIIIILFFISRYPIKLPRNNVAHCILYSVWFLGDAALLLASGFLSKGVGQRVVNDGLMLLEIGSYIGWTLLLTQQGEYQEMRVKRDISPATEKALIGELDAMNEVLLRAGRSMAAKR